MMRRRTTTTGDDETGVGGLGSVGVRQRLGTVATARRAAAATATTTGAFDDRRESEGGPRGRAARDAVDDDAVDDADDDDDRESGFVREVPGASNGLEEAVLAALRGVSLGEAAERAGVTSMVRMRRDGTREVDEAAVRAVTEAALDAASEEKLKVLERMDARNVRGMATDSIQGAFQRAVFAKKLHDAVARRVAVEVERRAKSDLQMARRRAQEEDLKGKDTMKDALERQRENPHKPWFLLENPKDEFLRMKKRSMLEEEAKEAGKKLDASALELWTTPESMIPEPVPDPRDDSILGTVKKCFYAVQSHPRPIQKVLDYLLGYSPSIDAEDLEEIAAYTKGLPVSRGKLPKQIAHAYAANLDKLLGERDKVALKTLIEDVKDEWSSHIRAGADAVKQLESTPLDSAEDIRTQNRDSWLRAMFPNIDWPMRNEKNYKFMESLRELHGASSTSGVGAVTSKPVPLAVARETLASTTKASEASEKVSIDSGGRKLHFTKDGIPIVAPAGYFPKTDNLDMKSIRAAAVEVEKRLERRSVAD